MLLLCCIVLYLLFGTVGAVLFIYIVVTNNTNNRNPKEVDRRPPLCVRVVLCRCEYRKIFVLCHSFSVNNWDVFRELSLARACVCMCLL